MTSSFAEMTHMTSSFTEMTHSKTSLCSQVHFTPGTCFFYRFDTFHRGTPVVDRACRRIHSIVYRREDWSAHAPPPPPSMTLPGGRRPERLLALMMY